MAVIRSNMEEDSNDIPRTRSFYRPAKDDFDRILDRLKAQEDGRTLEVSPTILDDGNETKQEKQERLRQEALQRDQYILSMRSNRHVVFAAKFARIKNQGLTKRFEKQLHIWNREMERNFRFVGYSERALEKEQWQRRARKEKDSNPRLQAPQKTEKPGGHVNRHSLKLPKLERYKGRKQRTQGGSDREQKVLKGNRRTKPEEMGFSNTSVRLPPIKTEKKQNSDID